MASKTLNRQQLGEGIAFSSVQDEKFRHNSISVNIIAPLSPEKASATALLPSLLRKGCATLPDYTMLERQLCELYGASLSGGVMKYGASQIIDCSISFIDDAYTLEGEVISARCADLLGDILLCPKMTDGIWDSQDFELERKNLIDSIEAEINEKRTYAINRCAAIMFEGSVMSTQRLGTAEGAKALTPAIVAERYREIMDIGRIEIIFTGCGDPAPAMEKFRQRFAGLHRHPCTIEKAVLPPASGVKSVTKRMDISQGKLVLGMRAGELDGSVQVDSAKLMTLLYGGTPSSRLFVNVREKLSLCYYCAARFDRSTATMMVDIGVEHQNRDKAQTAILEQLEVLAKGGFEDRELTETKLSYINGLRSISDSLSAIENWYLMQILNGGNRSPEEEAAAMETIDREQISAAAAKVTLDSVYFLTGNEEVTGNE